MEMYITESPSVVGPTGPKFASTNSIPLAIDESSDNNLSNILLHDVKGRRHSVLDDLRARRDNFFNRARRSSANIFEDKENNKKKERKGSNTTSDDEKKDKRRSSDGTRRGSIFYVSDDLLEENPEIIDDDKIDIKKGRRKSWHPLVKPPKTDRKRKKGLPGVVTDAGSSEALYGARQKRLSWWNIFVPESVSR
uniref:Uncharacterized protein n=1 Tax=Bracon brevicornis TaxID=1563983 RepID=A0A6V7ITR4_9HYME